MDYNYCTMEQATWTINESTTRLLNEQQIEILSLYISRGIILSQGPKAFFLMPSDPQSSVSVSGISEDELQHYLAKEKQSISDTLNADIAKPSVDQMRYALAASKPTPEVALPEPPTPEKTIVAGRGARVKPFDNSIVPGAMEGLGQTLYGAGKGAVSATFGTPGDINHLLQQYVQPMFPQGVQDVLQHLPAPNTSEQIAEMMPTTGTQTEKAATMLGQNVLAPLIGPGGIAATKGLPIGLAIKNKGGNWAQNSVNHLDALKYPIQNVGGSKFDFIRDNLNPAKVAEHIAELQKVGYSPEQIREVQNEIAINKWIDSKIKPYVRNEMGTPTDPVLALHEQGISHIQDIGTEHFDPIYWIKEQRQKAGMPESGFAKSPQAKDWENRADQSIKNTPAQLIAPGSNNYSADLGVLAGKNPDATVHELSANARRLGFEHLTDELKNAIAHNSDLPAHLRLKPEALDKVTVPQAVERVAKINEWRAEQMQKAAKESLEDFPIAHEDPSGYRIHELKLPTIEHPLSEGHELVPFMNEYGKPVHNIRDKSTGEYIVDTTKEAEHAMEQYSSKKNYEILDKALKNEGEQMGHCVGGYTDSVASGKTRIFSLRDPKGGAHATVEIRPHVDALYHPSKIPEDVKTQFRKESEAEAKEIGYRPGSDVWNNYVVGGEIQKGNKWLMNNPIKTLNVEQIKGKGNGKVSEKYRGYIKDWLNKEHESIGQVADLNHVGLTDLSDPKSLIPELKDMYGEDGIHLYNAAVDVNPNTTRFMSREDLRNFIEKPPEPVKEQKMLQGIYRGYAGENPASGQEGSIYASPQRAVGEYYANKRAKQTGEDPHLEMLLVDPFKGMEYGHATAGTGKQMPLVTRARQLTPEEIKSSTKLYAEGGPVTIDEMKLAMTRNK